MSAMSCRSTRMPALSIEASDATRMSPCSAAIEAAMFRAAREETAEHAIELRHVEQEGVMARVALDLDEADIGRNRVQRIDDHAALARREQPVAGEGNGAEAHRRAAKRIREDAAMLSREIEIIHRARDV